jgi:hypothetical protein
VDGKVRVQLFRVAFNDVKKLRVQVAGSWTNVPLANNAFYLDLPGIRYEQMGVVEATLANGSTQVEDLQTGTYADCGDDHSLLERAQMLMPLSVA